MIDILLATYNGEKYLNQQIDSILAQTCQDWQLLIRDDCSSDNTTGIIKNYTSKFPDKIRFIEDCKRHLGLAQNFAALLKSAQSNYIMFCDQDDVWLPNKIELTLNAMKEAEQNSPGLPLLVHTDLRLVDETLKTVAQSFWELNKISPQDDCRLKKIIYRNVVTGCTMMINKKAKDISAPIPKQARLHDWWIAVNVAKNGRIIHIPVQTILYRQHSGNIIGARKYRKLSAVFSTKTLNGIRNLFSDYRLMKGICPSASLIVLLLTNIRLAVSRRL
jgi:glycosyltransferase involved in cell wall biosynthesis